MRDAEDVCRITEQAAEVFGERGKAQEWLRTPNRALGGQLPLTLLETGSGVRQVEAVLGRISQGVFS